ncbi:RNB domain-containing ribonuclease [Francisella sp. Scap27]|uniref:ribonuclease catalytic domain-containing protein n=1 Tax=Francisella sp. Scap27 TaxID=2589986 RepID=UPI0015B7F231|nr:RNB domain-containing ribonuclease [Francisella sp. Scap27]QLE79021.1 RNB domain-containing ribonuclease [Francisella sp. Scap27]
MQKNSLIIFKSKLAKVVDVLDKKVDIETIDGKKIKLPPKNVDLLFTATKDFELEDIQELEIPELEMTWELLQEQDNTTLAELSELLFEKEGLNEAYTVWKLANAGEYFSFNDDFDVIIHSEEQKDKIIADREERLKKEQELKDFVSRIHQKTYLPEDEKFLKEIESLATLKSQNCRLFKHLKLEESENSSHKLLLEVGFWDEFVNPHLYRYGAELESNPAEFTYNNGSDLNRVDLTHLTAYAIDDEGSNDPDDAISWDESNDKMWVHVADPSSSIIFDDEVDVEARARGSNLYVPEHIISMLPTNATDVLGLGLNEVSPALSIGFKVLESGEITDIEICFSKIKVTRLSYEYAQENLSNLDLGLISEFAKNFSQKRLQNGAVELEFPEVKISLDIDKKVKISNLEKLASRTLVRDTMLMAGVAVGQYCQANQIPVPYSTQPAHELTPESLENLNTPAEMFAVRKKLQRGCHSTQPSIHGGMGLENYVQVTSPLRRYLDLVVHYQLRNHIEGKELINETKVSEIISQADIPIKANRQTERYSNQHWKLVYLMQNADLKTTATVVELLDRGRVMVSINELAMTKKLSTGEKNNLNDTIELLNTSVNLINQEAYFK